VIFLGESTPKTTIRSANLRLANFLGLNLRLKSQSEIGPTSMAPEKQANQRLTLRKFNILLIYLNFLSFYNSKSPYFCQAFCEYLYKLSKEPTEAKYHREFLKK